MLEISKVFGLICVALVTAPSAFAFGKAKPANNVVDQKISLNGVSSDAFVTALPSGGYVISDMNGQLVFTDAQGKQTATAAIQASPTRPFVMTDGTVAIFDNQGTLSFFSSAGVHKASISDWGLTPMPANHINMPHVEWDTFNRSQVMLDQSGAVLLAVSNIDHAIEDNTPTSHLENGSRRAVARTFDSNGKILGELQLDEWSTQIIPNAQPGFVMTNALGKIYRVGNDLVVQQQLQYLRENVPNKIGDVICVGVFADGGIGVGLWGRQELLMFGPDWSQNPVKSGAITSSISMDSSSCTVTSKQDLIIRTRNAENASASTEAVQLVNEKGEVVAGALFKGQVIDDFASGDGNFAIAYHPLGAAVGLLPTPFLPIPFLPVFAPNELTNKVNFAFFDSIGNEVQTILQAGSPNDNSSDLVFIGKSGSDLVVSNGNTAHFVDPTTGISAGDFSGLSRGQPTVGTDGTVAFVDDAGDLSLVKLKQ